MAEKNKLIKVEYSKIEKKLFTTEIEDDGTKKIEEIKNKICFKNLSIWLKILIILGWIYAAIFTLTFLIGFYEGVTAII